MASSSSTSEGRPAKRTKLDYVEDVTALVGPNETKFVVHKELIELFPGSMQRRMERAARENRSLTEADPDVFGTYLYYVYTSEVDVRKAADATSARVYGKEMPDKDAEELSMQLINTYALGDMLQDTCFCNAVVDETVRLVEGTCRIPTVRIIQSLWDKVPHQSMLTKLIVHYLAFDHRKEDFDETGPLLPPGIWFEIAKVSIHEQWLPWKTKTPRGRPRCAYHQHKDDADKCDRSRTAK
ncbi:hypothetical protein LTR37_009083 [Vermiconidia calcicola]|uniref:Uncharacterized protein n=1 Tax=Vermiconidia calcicola TaxID=1690605 RepID=A0ACC3NBX0_9PEZI|nr:hypothetical protein LTR37_009083 [Vermiconidia calcicola]